MPRTHLRLHRAAFRQWLLAQSPAHDVGNIQSCFTCPLAIYLTAVRQEEGCWVGERTWYDGNNRRHVLPPWAQRFVSAVDGSRTSGTTVRAVDALRLLEEL